MTSGGRNVRRPRALLCAQEPGLPELGAGGAVFVRDGRGRPRGRRPRAAGPAWQVCRSLRTQVRETDFLAAQLLSKTGYDPRAMVRYIARVQPDTAPDARYVRPSRAERIAGLEEIIAQLPAGGGAAPAVFERVQGMVRAAIE